MYYDWVESTIRNKWYSAYISYPERLLGTFANTFAEAIAGISNIDKPKDNDFFTRSPVSSVRDRF
ncbi:MAG: hypothetical protein KME52_02175 [Desmonostoc geniculatum HA4340-LM1]|jgi:hypothetical protein|nr:hypothetical protein [Desmonostoc geniculatum HA4340-LM1]